MAILSTYNIHWFDSHSSIRMRLKAMDGWNNKLFQSDDSSSSMLWCHKNSFNEQLVTIHWFIDCFLRQRKVRENLWLKIPEKRHSFGQNKTASPSFSNLACWHDSRDQIALHSSKREDLNECQKSVVFHSSNGRAYNHVAIVYQLLRPHCMTKVSCFEQTKS